MRVALIVLLLAAATLIVGAHVLVDEPLRRRTEADMNAALEGYIVHLGGLRFHPFGFGVDLLDLTVRQRAVPEPPVLTMRRLRASVEWRALLHRKVVARLELDEPHIHIDDRQHAAEERDDTPVESHGWQEAVQAIYPLDIDEVRVIDGDVTYVGTDATIRSLHLEHVALRAANIRNVRSPDRTYPSELHLAAQAAPAGRLKVDGRADFLAVPYAGIKARVLLDDFDLGSLAALGKHYDVRVRRGRLDVAGRVEYAPRRRVVDLHVVRVDGAEIDYVRRSAEADKPLPRQGGDAVLVRTEHVAMRDSTLGVIDQTTDPDYRLFVSHAALDLTQQRTGKDEAPVHGAFAGRFMDDGPLRVDATVWPQPGLPNFQLGVRVEDIDVRRLNDLWRARGGFDMAGGKFSVYSELQVRQGMVDGYVKPLFVGLDVYDRDQDREKGIVQQLYEGVVGGMATVLQNPPRGQVATETSLSGPLEDPHASTFQIVVRLIENAWVRAILPGLDRRRHG